MKLNSLTAISPIDGRYRGKVEELDNFYSEYALIKYRVKVEVEYFIALCELPVPQLVSVDAALFPALRDIYSNFSVEDAQRIKDIESVTNHDVKAVEYFIKEKFDILGLAEYKEFIHFGLTSQDINNTSTPMLIKDSMEQVYTPLLTQLVEMLNGFASEWNEIPMLAKTHGQPASPTRLGKEIKVFAYRIEVLMEQLKTVKYSGKFGGATGNFNAHLVAYPNINWLEFGQNFLTNSLAIVREDWTTQISNYDNLATLFDLLKRINTVIIDLDRDIWQYVSMEYFKQKIKAGEVGSSAMPHKFNPIDFENSEGNLGIANAIFEHLSAKLPISRLQRDLTDSTVLRNVGVPMGHTVIALHSTIKGLNKLLLNEPAISRDLDSMWNVVAEAIQTILRREGYEKPYETLKELTRTNSVVNAESIAAFIDTLKVSDEVKAELKTITPHTYTGY